MGAFMSLKTESSNYYYTASIVPSWMKNVWYDESSSTIMKIVYICIDLFKTLGFCTLVVPMVTFMIDLISSYKQDPIIDTAPDPIAQSSISKFAKIGLFFIGLIAAGLAVKRYI